MSKVKKSEKRFKEDTSGKLILECEILYDKAERVIWEQHLFPSGEIQLESEFEYNEDNIVREKSWNELGGWTELKYLYDKEGQLVYRTSIDDKGNKEIFKRTISEREVIVELIDSEGVVYQKEVRTNNEEGNYITSVFYEDGLLTEEHIYEYNSSGKMTKKIVTINSDSEEDQQIITEYKYTQDGKESGEVEKNEQGVILSQIDFFYKGDLLCEEIINGFEDSNETVIINYEYDQKGRVIKIVHSNKSGKEFYQEISIYNEDETVIQTMSFSTSGESLGPPDQKKMRCEVEYFE